MKQFKKAISRKVAYFLYHYFAQYLPNSYNGKIGRISNAIRVKLCHKMFKKCGKISTINRRVDFGNGFNIEMGDGSGIGEYTQIPPNTIIGKNVMFGRYCFVLSRNHRFDRTDVPIVQQGFLPFKQTVIEDDCWIGMHTLFTPGRHVKKGTIIGMGSVLTKDFPEYSILGGAPAKLIKSRLQNEEPAEK